MAYEEKIVWRIDGPYSFRQVSQVPKPESSLSTAIFRFNHTLLRQSQFLSEEGEEIGDARETNSTTTHHTMTCPVPLNHFLNPHTYCPFIRQMVSGFDINEEKFADYIALNLVRVSPLANTGSFEVEFEVGVETHELTYYFEDEEEEEEEEDEDEEEEIEDLVLDESFESARQNSLAIVAPASASSLQELKRSICQEDEFRDLNCVVCQEDLSAGEKIIEMPCSHIFHDNCLLDWLRGHHVCPVCRFQLPEQPIVGH